MRTNLKQMSKSEILELAREVGSTLTNLGAAGVAALAKAEESSLDKGSVPPEGSSPSASASGSPSASPEASASGAPIGDPSAPPTDAPPSAPAADPSAPPAGDPAAAGEQPPSFEELVAAYQSLPPEDLQAHAAAIQQVLQQAQGAPGAGAAAGAPPSAPPSAPPGPLMGKGEVSTATSTGPTIGLEPGRGKPGHVATENPNIGPTKKSEADELRERLAKTEKSLEAVGQVLDVVLTTPQRRAVTGLTWVPYPDVKKSEPTGKKPFAQLTRPELDDALKRVSATPSLTKSEREVINGFYLSPGSVRLSDVESIYNKS